MKRAILLSMVPALLLGCGDDKDWDQEIIVQLFRPAGVDVGQVTVTATQGGTTGTIKVGDVFADCESNRIRIIPKPDGGEVKIAATSANGGSAEPRTVQASDPGPIPMKIGTDGGSGFEPSRCLPIAGPEAGPEAGSIPTGESCVTDSSCVGGLCLKETVTSGNPMTLPGGYCTRKVGECANGGGDEACELEGEICWSSTNGNLEPQDSYCLKKCTLPEDCRKAEGYVCKTAGDCLPE